MEAQMPCSGGEGAGPAMRHMSRGTALPWRVEGGFLEKHDSQSRQSSVTIQDVLVDLSPVIYRWETMAFSSLKSYAITILGLGG